MLRFMMRNVLPRMRFAGRVEEAAQSFVFMAVTPTLKAKRGGLCGEMALLESSPASRDEEKAGKFGAWAEQVTALAPAAIQALTHHALGA